MVPNLLTEIILQLERVPRIIRRGKQAITMNADKTVIINNVIDLLKGTEVRLELMPYRGD